MKRLNIFKRGIAMLCSALVLSLSFCSLPVYAADDYETDVTLSKLVDIAMTAQGAVLSQSVCESVADSLLSDVQSALETVYNAMSDAGETAWNNAANYIADCVEDGGIQKALNQLVQSYYDQGLFLPTLTAYQVAAAFSPNEHGGGGRKRGETYTLDEEFVDSINDVFQVWWSENEDYYIWRVPAFSELSTEYFVSDDYTFMDNFFEAIAEPNKVYYLYAYHAKKIADYDVLSALQLITLENDDCYFYTDLILPNKNANVYPYYDGVLQGYSYYGFYNSSGDFKTSLTFGEFNSILPDEGISILDLELVNYPNANSVRLFDTTWSGSVNPTGYASYTRKYSGLVGRNAFTIRLFKDEDSGNNFDVGNQIVYYTPSYDPDTTTAVTYTGDYYCDTSGVYNYGTVQDSINNIQGDVTDSVIDSVVDESVTTIINNYYYTSSDSDSDDDSGSSSGSGDSDSSDSSNPFEGLLEKIGEVLGNAVGILDDLLALALGFIVDAVNSILSMITSVIDLINTFREEVSGLSGALAEFFPYIPEEVWRIITATITIICGLAIIDYLRSK